MIYYNNDIFIVHAGGDINLLDCTYCFPDGSTLMCGHCDKLGYGIWYDTKMNPIKDESSGLPVIFSTHAINMFLPDGSSVVYITDAMGMVCAVTMCGNEGAGRVRNRFSYKKFVIPITNTVSGKWYPLGITGRLGSIRYVYYKDNDDGYMFNIYYVDCDNQMIPHSLPISIGYGDHVNARYAIVPRMISSYMYMVVYYGNKVDVYENCYDHITYIGSITEMNKVVDICIDKCRLFILAPDRYGNNEVNVYSLVSMEMVDIRAYTVC